MMRERRRRSSFAVHFGPLLLVAACATTAIGGLVPREANASLAGAASLEDLPRSSSGIARVTAEGSESAWEDGRIVTYSRVRVDSVIAGRAPGDARALRIRTRGGRVGDIGQIVEGEAVFSPAESSLVFLTPMLSPSTDT